MWIVVFREKEGRMSTYLLSGALKILHLGSILFDSNSTTNTRLNLQMQNILFFRSGLQIQGSPMDTYVKLFSTRLVWTGSYVKALRSSLAGCQFLPACDG